MTLTLYGAARSRASMVRWYLEEKAIPYAFVQLDLNSGEHRHEPFTTINPFGKVPALVDDALASPDGGPLKLFESGAILFHLAEHYGEEFDPQEPGGAEAAAARRSLTAQWLLFANASLGPAMFQLEARPDEFARQLATVDGLLAAGPHLLAGVWGDPGWGAADCVLQSYLAYIPLFCPQVDLSPYPAVQAAIEATRNRPLYQKAMGVA
ncbi:glutathione S-transferase family protein [Vulcanococcus limneticus]|uniref:glutathione S-transferase family protein n=1 Tax=Vulcanococcus limneticus TaxID=2170428 RepID=UPI00398BF2FE